MGTRPTQPFRYEAIFETVLREEHPYQRWEKLAAALADIGCDQINYGFLDLETAARMDARCDPALSTMAPDWIAYYVDKRFDLVDHALAHVRAGNHVPMRWTDAPTSGTRSHTAFEEACEAGLKSGNLVPLAGPRASKLPGASIMIGSSVHNPDSRARWASTFQNSSHWLTCFTLAPSASSCGDTTRLQAFQCVSGMSFSSSLAATASTRSRIVWLLRELRSNFTCGMLERNFTRGPSQRQWREPCSMAR